MLGSVRASFDRGTGLSCSAATTEACLPCRIRDEVNSIAPRRYPWRSAPSMPHDRLTSPRTSSYVYFNALSLLLNGGRISQPSSMRCRSRPFTTLFWRVGQISQYLNAPSTSGDVTPPLRHHGSRKWPAFGERNLAAQNLASRRPSHRARSHFRQERIRRVCLHVPILAMLQASDIGLEGKR